ncbi:MAG: DUF2723 domain-containing protein [Elusimicrobiota bacterium]
MNKSKKIKLKKKEIKISYWTDFAFSKRDLISASVIFLFVFVVYNLFLCRMFYFDALMFASEVVREPRAWANHFNFTFYGNIFWKILKYTGLIKLVETSPPEGYRTLQLMNAIFGSLTVAFVFIWITKLTDGRTGIATVFSLLLAFSYAFWWRNTDAHVYPPSVFHQFVTLWLAWSYTRYPNKTKLLLLAVSTGITVLIHQGNVFFIPAILTAVIYPNLSHRSPKGKLVKNLFLFITVAGLIIVIPYLWALSYQERILLTLDGKWNINRKTLLSAFEWLLGNADFIRPDGTFDIKLVGYWNIANLKNMTIGNIKTLMRCIIYTGGGFAYGCYTFGWKANRFWPVLFQDLFIPLNLFFFFKTKLWQKYSQLFMISVVWLGTYILCVTNFNPGNLDYWYQHLITIFLIASCGFSEFLKDEKICLLLKKTLLGLLLCSVVIVPSVNFFDSIYPISRAENNENYLRAIWIRDHVKKGGVIIISGLDYSNPQKVYIPSFAGIGRISFDLIFCYYVKEQGLQILKNQVETLASQGTTIYTLDGIFSKTTEEGLKQWNISIDEIKEIFKPYEFKTLGIYRDGMKIMQVLPKRGSAAFHRREGIKFYNLKEYNKSLEEFLGIPEKDKTTLDYKLIGNCLVLTNNPQKALNYWTKALQLNPADTDLKQLLEHYRKTQ